ncbi:MAG: hypothetical protein GWP10_12665 [Nitrospiraceae bacterium]|nr:hypothetical protein [Nitrospiraceae bacterium]
MTPDTDKIGFMGGEPTIHLPYIEEVVQEVQENYAEIGVGIATNGFCTPKTLWRVIDISTSISLRSRDLLLISVHFHQKSLN